MIKRSFLSYVFYLRRRKDFLILNEDETGMAVIGYIRPAWECIAIICCLRYNLISAREGRR
jgi:hypothetical protein